MMIAISSNGYGAGKTTFARRIGRSVHSLADGIRRELAEEYGNVNWWDKSPEGKLAIVPETGMSVRDMLIRRGQERCVGNPTYWVDALLMDVNWNPYIVIDDLRKIIELARLRDIYGQSLVHYHLIYPGAVPEPQYDGEELAKVADYVIYRGSEVGHVPTRS